MIQDQDALWAAVERFLDWRDRGFAIQKQKRVDGIKRSMRRGRRKEADVSFKNLKADFEAAEKAGHFAKMEPFRHLYLKTLFELNGNLDTLALAARVVQEQAIEIGFALKRIADHFESKL